MSRPLTLVRLASWPDRQNAWLRFGNPVAERHASRRRGSAWFEPGQLFGYIDWQANDYGTIRWTFAILRAGAPGERLTTIRGIAPAAELLLFASGKPAVLRALELVDHIEAQGIDPAEIGVDYWRAVANRFAGRGEPRPFDLAGYEAGRARAALLG